MNGNESLIYNCNKINIFKLDGSAFINWVSETTDERIFMNPFKFKTVLHGKESGSSI